MTESFPPYLVAAMVILGVIGFIVGYEVRDQTYYRSTARKGAATMAVSVAIVVAGIYIAASQQIG